jgi:hypothetical protein
MVHDSEPTLIASRDDNEHGPLDIAIDTRSRRKALLRFILFVALAVGFTLLALVVVKKILRIDFDVDGHMSLQTLLVGECIVALVNAVLPTAIMIGATRKSPADFGWARHGRWRDLGIGILAGSGSMAALLAAMSWLGGYSFGECGHFRRHFCNGRPLRRGINARLCSRATQPGNFVLAGSAPHERSISGIAPGSPGRDRNRPGTGGIDRFDPGL